MSITKEKIIIKNASENNLKNVSLEIPKNKLVIMTGLSGSGKSSLAFNTIYEEGRRRYMDSLSSYARQFLGSSKKPKVDSIEGLSPSISIEQKTTHNNPRSTVGTVTEIYDYLRLLYSKIGKPFCPNHKKPIFAQTTKEILDAVYKNEEGSKIIVLSPILKGKKGTHQTVLERLKRESFVRVKINNEIRNLDEEIVLEKNKPTDLSIVVDRLILNKDNYNRLSTAIETAIEYSKGFVDLEFVDSQKTFNFSNIYSCNECNFSMPLMEARLFSFNSPFGMCNTCKGIGSYLKPNFDLIVPDKNLSINQGAIKIFKSTNKTSVDWQTLEALTDHYGIDRDKPIKYLTKKEIDILKHGSKDEEISFVVKLHSGNYQRNIIIPGVLDKIQSQYNETSKDEVRLFYKQSYMSESVCDTCHGARLNQHALAVQIDGLNIFDIGNISIQDTYNKIDNLSLTPTEQEIANLIVKEIKNRLSFLINVGLDYLLLNRLASTLSGGESQRIRLATQIGSQLTGVLYVLDEPSIGLHQRDNRKLIQTLKKMVDIGNSLIVVEHDEEIMYEADHIIDIGPEAGDNGGYVVAQGTLEDIVKANTITGQYLGGAKKIEVPKFRRKGNSQYVIIKGARENNLKNINVKIPLGKFVVVTGVSGSGKSTLINDILVKGVQKQLNKDFTEEPGAYSDIEGLYNIDKLVKISQDPIGRTPRSNPATYIKVLDEIRDLFANTEEARARGYSKGRFSFNVDGGRCERCYGDGQIWIEMHFLPDVYIQCDNCDGTRFKKETLEVKYRGKNISEVLNMRASEALEFFNKHPKIQHKLQILVEVGLGYIKLGQSATTLSGGEAQRVKLALHLQKKPTGKTLYVLDEPSTGLHTYDVQKLLNIINRIVDNKDTVVVIEHNLDIIKNADYIIDLGPGGGINGGKILAQGTPEEVALVEHSFTGQFLKDKLND